MKRFLSILAMAAFGAAAGSAVRQMLDSSSRKEGIDIAVSPGPVFAGLLAGLMSPKAKGFVALVAGANTAFNESTLRERFLNR